MQDRTWGTPGDLTNPTQVSLTQNGVYGQTTGIGSFQNIPMTVDQAGHNILLNSSLDFLATVISQGTSAECVYIHLSWNEEPYTFTDGTTGFLITDFLSQILVKVSSPDYPVNGANIQNTLASTWLASLNGSQFHTTAYLYGSPGIPGPTQPETVDKVKTWLFGQPGREYAEQAQAVGAPKKWDGSEMPVYWFNQFAVPTEAYFQTQDKSAFSPLSATPGTMDNALLLAMVAIYCRSPEGRHSLERMVLKYLDSCARIVESVEDSCHANWLTALNNQHIAAGIAHRIGLMDDGSYLKTIEHYRAVFDKMLEKAYVVEGLHTLVQGTKNYAVTKVPVKTRKSRSPISQAADTFGLPE